MTGRVCSGWMQCSHASSLKLIDWLVRCHGQVGEAGRAGWGREMVRIWLVLGGRWDIYICVLVYVCVYVWETNSRARTQLASSGLVLVSCPWPWRAQESAVSLWLIDTDTPQTPAPRHSQTSTSIPQSLQPSASLLLFFSSWPMPGGHFFEETCWGGRERWKTGSQPPSWLWPLLEHALLSPSLSHSVGFISVSHVSDLTVVLVSLHLACWQQPAHGPSVPVVLSNVAWMSHSHVCVRCSRSMLDHGWSCFLHYRGERWIWVKSNPKPCSDLVLTYISSGLITHSVSSHLALQCLSKCLLWSLVIRSHFPALYANTH